MTQAERHQGYERAIKRMTEAFNTGNTDIVDELVGDSPNLNRSPMPGTSRDKLGLKVKIQHLRSAFPDAKFTVEEMKTEGDTVTFSWRLEGTHRGHFLDKRPTNKKISFRGKDVVRFQDGIMVEHRSLDNKGGMLGRTALQ